MRIINRRARQHHAMRMERRRRNRRAPMLMQKRQMRLTRRQQLATRRIPHTHRLRLRARREHRRMLMDAERTQRRPRLRSRDGANAAAVAQVPELDVAATTRGDELAGAAALQRDIGDPLAVLLPDAHEGLGGATALVVDADGAVAEARDKHVAFELVDGERGDAAAGAGGDVVGADLRAGVPDADDFDVAADEQGAAALLPVEDEAGVAGAGHEVGEGAEGGDELGARGGVVVAEDLDDAVGGAGHEEGLVVFVDEADVGDAGAGWVGVGEAVEAAFGLPVPYATREASQSRCKKPGM